MSRKSRKKSWSGIQRRTRPGAPPGSVVVDPHAPKPSISLIAYGPAGIQEQRIDDVNAIRPLVGNYPVLWVNVDGLGDAAVVSGLGQIFGIHALALEDVVNTHQRAKVEVYPNNLFVVGRMIEDGQNMTTDQLSLFLGKNYVVTFQELPGDCFDPIRERVRKPGTKIRESGPDYLAYALIDSLIDHYFPVLEEYGERLEATEEDVISKPDQQLVSRIHETKRDLLVLRRAIWPLREAINTLARDPSPFVTDETRLYFRDCYDHTIQIIDLLENYRDVASGMMEVYLSSVSNRLNEIMKILTMFTAFFIPLSLIAGIYGMNFNTQKSPFNMPELNWTLGYPFALALMAAIAAAMILFFRKQGWLGTRK